MCPELTQGHEYQAMLSFPFETHTISLVSVERPGPKLISLLRARGFQYVCDHGPHGDGAKHDDLCACKGPISNQSNC